MNQKQKFIGISLVLFLLTNNLFASEILKKEISFFVDHTTKEVTGICNEVITEPVSIQLIGKTYTLKSPFLITVPVSKVSSGDEGRDSHIKEILGFPDFPNVLVKVEAVKFDATAGYTITGKLTIHGKTKEFSSSANLDSTDPNIILVEGKVIAKFSEYELENPSLLFMKAKDNIEIKYLFQIKVK
ncbi:YceI family protein [Leptospira ognonensis]|uniref:YceI family protein n=1 Tax=Leptospira ognonensis TaxID=2484945 RepID=A0A4R9JU54_9LEPT|nr:YceI family protein [Leptospira ognonensis]TGL56319.1 YceI family protein [Leptospira ognonensis]